MVMNTISGLFGRNGHQNNENSRENGQKPNYGNPSGIYDDDYNYSRYRLALAMERIAELQTELEDRGWARIGDASDQSFEFDVSALRAMRRISRLMFLKNPIINRGVMVKAAYVWAQGINIAARDPIIQKIVDRFWKDKGNRAEFTSHRAVVLKECDLQVDGDIFFALFVNTQNGAISIRTLPVNQVEAIIHNPEDRKDPWFYKRVYNRTDLKSQFGQTQAGQVTVYYRDWQLDPEIANPALGVNDFNARFAEDTVKIFHIKSGGLSEMQFGVPETYQALDWARAYREFLEDWATIVKSLSRFAWRMTVPSGVDGVATAQSVMGSTVTTESDESNPAPPAGSLFVQSGDFSLESMPKTGATIQADDGRRLLLMAAAALGLPETFFGDVSVGTLATAESLDRPTELGFKDRQTMWQDAIEELLQYCVHQAALSKYLGLELRRVDPDPNDEYDEEIFKVFGPNGKEIDTTIDVSFPPILERDIKKIMDSIVVGATLDGKTELPNPIVPRREVSRMVMTALNVTDVEGQLDKIYDEKGNLREDNTPKPTPTDPKPQNEPPDDPTDDKTPADPNAAPGAS